MKWTLVCLGIAVGVLFVLSSRIPDLILSEDGPLGEWCE